MRILITGGAGNLGTFLARHLVQQDVGLIRLMVHRTAPAADLQVHPQIEIIQADLDQPATLSSACEGVTTVVHTAGQLFRPWPELFLERTNVTYVKNLLAACTAAGVQRFCLISFPHVEGETTPAQPAIGRLDGKPRSIHARTRLEAERALVQAAHDTRMTPVILRAGMIYGKGVLMIEAAHKLMARRLLPVWRDPTWIHLLSLPDFVNAVQAAIIRPGVAGIYNLGDEAPLTLQEFLNRSADHWGFPRPLQLPDWLFPLAGLMTEVGATVLRTPAPITRDFIRIGMASYVGDTTRMREELLPELIYPTLELGINTL
jgi:nucleoside-diphosphate-sugar epimerase